MLHRQNRILTKLLSAVRQALPEDPFMLRQDALRPPLVGDTCHLTPTCQEILLRRGILEEVNLLRAAAKESSSLRPAHRQAGQIVHSRLVRS
jgi:hypothetical protein